MGIKEPSDKFPVTPLYRLSIHLFPSNEFSLQIFHRPAKVNQVFVNDQMITENREETLKASEDQRHAMPQYEVVAAYFYIPRGF